MRGDDEYGHADRKRNAQSLRDRLRRRHLPEDEAISELMLRIRRTAQPDPDDLRAARRQREDRRRRQNLVARRKRILAILLSPARGLELDHAGLAAVVTDGDGGYGLAGRQGDAYGIDAEGACVRQRGAAERKGQAENGLAQ